jgi:hypothetical protein
MIESIDELLRYLYELDAALRRLVA